MSPTKQPRQLTEEERARNREILAGGALAYGGAKALGHAKPLITGRTRLYHGTTPEMAAKIQQEGIRPRAQTGSFGITELTKKEVEAPSRNLAFATTSRGDAQQYATQAKFLASQRAYGARPEDMAQRLNQVRQDPEYALKAMNPFQKGIVAADVPLWKPEVAAKLRENPEVAGGFAKTRTRIKPFIDMRDPVSAFVQDWQTYQSLKGSKAFEGGLQPEFVRGSPKFQPHSLKEFGEYAKTHPGRLAGGLALAAGGTALAGYGVKKLLNRRKKKAGESEKRAMVAAFFDELEKIMGDDNTKLASGLRAEVLAGLDAAKELFKTAEEEPERKRLGTKTRLALSAGAGYMGYRTAKQTGELAADISYDRARKKITRMADKHHAANLVRHKDGIPGVLPGMRKEELTRLGKKSKRISDAHERLVDRAFNKRLKMGERGAKIGKGLGVGLTAALGAKVLHDAHKAKKQEAEKTGSASEIGKKALKVGADFATDVGKDLRQAARRSTKHVVTGAATGLGSGAAIRAGTKKDRIEEEPQKETVASVRSLPAIMMERFEKLARESKEREELKPNLNAFQKHPKKILGGLAAAAGAGLAAPKLLKKYQDLPRTKAKRRVKLTNEPFLESGRARGFTPEGKRTPVREVIVGSPRNKAMQMLTAAAEGKEYKYTTGASSHESRAARAAIKKRHATILKVTKQLGDSELAHEMATHIRKLKLPK